MVSRNVLRWSLATLALICAQSATAEPINFTGFVENDFQASDKSNHIIQVNPDPFNRIVQMNEMTSAGIINGYALKDMRLNYDFASDTLSMGLNTYSIAGSAIGNGGPDMAALLSSRGGVDPPNLGGKKSITIGFAGQNLSDSSKPGEMLIVAGVPANKNQAGPGLDGFTVSKYTGSNGNSIQNSYGANLSNHQGELAFSPSADHPGFEFTIKNFSQIAPNVLDPSKGFWLKAYLGSPDDVVIGEEGTGYLRVPAFEPFSVPEPTTWLAWTLVAGAGAVAQFRRRRQG